jgi:hypothetical protein
MPTQAKPTALQAYMAAYAEALALVERIHEAIANHDISPDPDSIHWGHVGDIWGHVGDIVEARRQLQAISDSLFAEGEYAPEAK